MAKMWVGPVWLEPVEHVYIHRETNEHFTSVTTTLHHLVNEFDEYAVSKAIENQPDSRKKEEYLGMTQTQILDYWQFLNDQANEYGTMIHETIENYLLKDKIYFPKDKFKSLIIDCYENLEVDEGEEMWPERIMFSEKHKLAGTADLIIDIDETYFDVGDWKGLDINTPIFTLDGWKTMGTIQKNDIVYDMDGNPTKVLHTSTVKNTKCYEIIFDNNEKIISDFEHRWLVSFLRDDKTKDIVMTSEELFKYINELNNSGKRWSHKLPKIKIGKPLNNKDIELPIDPYVLGVWLGDGHSIDTKITNMYDEIWNEIKKRGYKIGDDVSQGSSGKATTRTLFNCSKIFKELNIKSNKHIPDIYFKSSYSQRLDLLRGLMDSDGYYNPERKRFVMSTTRKKQATFFLQLISSLGIKGTLIDYNKTANGKRVNVFDVCFSTDNLNPFLCRKNLNIKYTKNNKKKFKNITSIKEVKSIPTRCIEVDSPTHTFLYGYTFSVTHNTNKRFEFYDRFGFKTLKGPLSHLQDCHYSIYTVQLSIYALMYEMETGRKCRHMWIGYWDRDLETLYKIPIMYLKHEAQAVLDYHKNTH